MSRCTAVCTTAGLTACTEWLDSLVVQSRSACAGLLPVSRLEPLLQREMAGLRHSEVLDDLLLRDTGLDQRDRGTLELVGVGDLRHGCHPFSTTPQNHAV